MTTTGIDWGIVLAAAAALGAGSLAAWGLMGLGGAVGRLRRFRLWTTPSEVFFRRQVALDSLSPGEEALAPEALYDLEKVPWELLRVGGALAGLALTYLLLAERNPLLAACGLGGVFVPRLVRGYLVRCRRAEIDRQVRDFIFLLRPALQVQGGLRPALEEVAGRLDESVVRRRLRHHLDRAFATEPVAVIEALSEDLRSPDVERLVLGIRAARQGGLSYAEAVTQAADEAAEQIREEARVAIEETPIRLLVPMLLLLLPPILVLTLYPLIARLMALLGSPASAGMPVW